MSNGGVGGVLSRIRGICRRLASSVVISAAIWSPFSTEHAITTLRLLDDTDCPYYVVFSRLKTTTFDMWTYLIDERPSFVRTYCEGPEETFPPANRDSLWRPCPEKLGFKDSTTLQLVTCQLATCNAHAIGMTPATLQKLAKCLAAPLPAPSTRF